MLFGQTPSVIFIFTLPYLAVLSPKTIHDHSDFPTIYSQFNSHASSFVFCPPNQPNKTARVFNGRRVFGQPLDDAPITNSSNGKSVRKVTSTS